MLQVCKIDVAFGGKKCNEMFFYNEFDLWAEQVSTNKTIFFLLFANRNPTSKASLQKWCLSSRDFWRKHTKWEEFQPF